MSRVYDALRRMELDRRGPGGIEPDDANPVEFLQNIVPQPLDLSGVQSIKLDVSPTSRVVALTERRGLGAEEFRALATRLENLQTQRELKSLQVTSGEGHEGKTLIAANLALTFAQHSTSKVLLVEGDFRRPTLATLLGLTELRGISHWRECQDEEISSYVYRLGQLPAWFLPAGDSSEQPSHILQSTRFVEALVRLVSTFDWIIVDSTPLLPFADANLWSRLLDGMLLVVREGVTAAKALKRGLEGIDNPNLIGVVLNDASELVDPKYETKYYAQQKTSFMTRSARRVASAERD